MTRKVYFAPVFVSPAPLGFLLPFAQLEEAGAPRGISKVSQETGVFATRPLSREMILSLPHSK